MNLTGLFKDLPTLETDRLLLRKISPEDADDFFEFASDLQVALYTTWNPHQSVEQSRQTIKSILAKYETGEPGAWGITLKTSPKLIGYCGLSHWEPDHRKASLFYFLERAYWGQGLVTEAVRALLDFGFERMDLNRIGANGHPANRATFKVLAKAGLQYEATYRQDFIKNGEYEDSEIWSILRREWEIIHNINTNQ